VTNAMSSLGDNAKSSLGNNANISLGDQRYELVGDNANNISLAVRGRQALVCGLSGIPVLQFARGVALGALITMPCQLLVGFLFRATPNVYVSTLALVAGPTVVGQFAGVAMVRSPFISPSRAPAHVRDEAVRVRPRPSPPPHPDSIRGAVGGRQAVGGLFFASKEAQAGQSKRDGEGESDGTAAAST
jgi:hypothetical protein